MNIYLNTFYWKVKYIYLILIKLLDIYNNLVWDQRLTNPIPDSPASRLSAQLSWSLQQ
jgi:hypothetical protein